MMQAVQSSNIAEIGYEKASQKLVVKFHSGDYYIYHVVPVLVWTKLMLASSYGTYLNANIKKKYMAQKVSKEDIEELFKPTVKQRHGRGTGRRITEVKRQKLRSMPGTYMYF